MVRRVIQLSISLRVDGISHTHSTHNFFTELKNELFIIVRLISTSPWNTFLKEKSFRTCGKKNRVALAEHIDCSVSRHHPYLVIDLHLIHWGGSQWRGVTLTGRQWRLKWWYQWWSSKWNCVSLRGYWGWRRQVVYVLVLTVNGYWCGKNKYDCEWSGNRQYSS